MTVTVNIEETGKKIAEAVPGCIIASDRGAITVDGKSMAKVADFLKTAPGLEFDYLTVLTAVDYLDYFEVIYRLVSLKNNQSLMLKTRVFGRENPSVPSVTATWRAAYYQEREVFDLLGIRFDGHPDMRRLLLWEGFKGHPLRRDYL
jgi:NADH-quinone oxidoreductase subunit C